MVQVASHYEDAIKEARWVDSLVAKYPQIQGIVALAPLEDADNVHAYLDILQQIPRVKGIRRLIQNEPLGFARQPDFVSGVQALAAYGFSFDICIYHPQMADVLYLVERCPQIQFVLDHIGKPGIKDGLLQPWKQQIKALAAHENVWCKLSGMVTEADHQGWTPDDLKPYVDHVINCFGVERLMYGGDWPVVKLASAYARWLETIQALTAHWSEAEKQKVFYENAGRFYRL
jgi:L-fuconolactonase